MNNKPILVTGTSGSGKTTLVAYARSRNDDRFFDADVIEGLCEWRELETGKVLGLVTDYKETGLDDWYQKYGWYLRADRLRTFLNDNPGAIICGSSENIVDYYSLFDMLIIIRVTKEELFNNLRSPERENPFGNTENQRKGFMGWQDYLLKEAEKYKPTIVDGNSTESTYHKIISAQQ